LPPSSLRHDLRSKGVGRPQRTWLRRGARDRGEALPVRPSGSLAKGSRMKAAEAHTAHPEITKLACGCSVRLATRTSGRRVISRCVDAEKLWSELIEARDEMQAIRVSGKRVGKKPAIDAFAAARDAHHAHAFGEGG
jgi:hypothetical protein